MAGLGLAATRDFVSFLRYATTDDPSSANPLAEDVQHTFTWAVSQPGRYLNDFQTLGFNEDENGRRVLDGIQNWVAGSSGVALNYRFAQTARTERNRQNHFYPEGVFPFAYPVTHDRASGRSGGRAERCLESNTCPKVFEINSANEYWVKAGSLLHTDTAGNDLPDPDHVRFFLIAGAQHGRGSSTPGLCQQPRNPTDPAPAMRALFVALDQWVADGVTPPESRVPRGVGRNGGLRRAAADDGHGGGTPVQTRVSDDSRCHVYGRRHDPPPVRLRSVVRRGDRDTGVAHVRRSADLSILCVEDGCRRQRGRGDPTSTGGGASGHDDRVGPASSGIWPRRRVRGRWPEYLPGADRGGPTGDR